MQLSLTLTYIVSNFEEGKKHRFLAVQDKMDKEVTTKPERNGFGQQ